MELSEWTQEKMPFPALTILVGKNATGKTRLLRLVEKQYRTQYPDNTVEWVPFISRVDDRLSVISEALSNTKPTLVIVDAIDAKLHPVTQKTIMARTLQCVKNNPNLRVIYTCYSPIALGDVSFDSVFVLECNNVGVSYIQPITACPKYKCWQSFLTVGEFWSMAGESWVVDTEKQSLRSNK